MTAECQRILGTNLRGTQEGRTCLGSAVEGYKLLGQNLEMAISMRQLGLSYWSVRHFQDAIPLQEKAVSIFWRYDFNVYGAETRLELGMSQMAQGELPDAKLTLDIALKENKKNGTQGWRLKWCSGTWHYRQVLFVNIVDWSF